ncbi:MAG: VOC family protein, partial [Candidatus Eisenbacteria bacterium]
MNARLPDDISLGPVRLRVADARRTGAWLERILGLQVLAAVDGLPCYGSAAGLRLVELLETPGAEPVPERGSIGLYHYGLLLPGRADLGRFLRHLEEAGERFGSSDHLFSEAIYLTDPDGITVEVYADRPRDQWVYRDGQVVGTLDPLDARGLLAAAGEQRWTGAPVGTVMGHLHFYARDLGVARRFHMDGLGFGLATGLFPGALFVSAGGYHHHLGLNIWAAAQPVATAADAGLERWTLVVPGADDRDSLRSRLHAQAARIRPFAHVGILSGKRIVNVVPEPGAVSHSSEPPARFRMFWHTQSPRPVPLPTGLVVKNGSKIRARTSGVMPAPVSRTRRTTWPGSGADSTATVPPRALASTALRSRLTSTCPSWTGGMAALPAGSPARDSATPASFACC